MARPDAEAWTPAAVPRGAGRVLVEKFDTHTELIFDNKGAANALSPGMMLDLHIAVAQFEQAVPRCLLLRGQGSQAFCAGGDLRSVRRYLLQEGVAGGMVDFMGDLLDRLAALPLVVLAAVEGAALGGGAEILTACDEVFASRTALVGFVHARLGVSPGWGGGARLVRRLGSKRALSLLLETGSPDAASAYRRGLVDHLCDPGTAVNAARSRASALARLPPRAVAAAVEIARSGQRATERQHFQALWGGPDHLDALKRLGKG